MKLEQQVVSLDLAKKLKLLNVKQESLFYWHNVDTIPSVICGHWYPEWPGDFQYSAYTAGELGELLPSFYKIEKIVWKLRLDKSMKENGYIVEYYESKRKGLTKRFYDKNEANARARMLIYLIKNNLNELREIGLKNGN